MNQTEQIICNDVYTDMNIGRIAAGSATDKVKCTDESSETDQSYLLMQTNKATMTRFTHEKSCLIAPVMQSVTTSSIDLQCTETVSKACQVYPEE